jgi:hypothetical protein
MSVSCECCVLSLRRADHSSMGVLLSVACPPECNREALTVRRPRPTRAVESLEEEELSYHHCFIVIH